MYDEKKLVYIAGNNVVLLDLHFKTQSFISASENAHEINFVTVSPQKRLLAVCEKATPNAQVVIYELHNKRRKQALPEHQVEDLSIQGREILCCAFSDND